jgi:hypothetical protein
MKRQLFTTICNNIQRADERAKELVSKLDPNLSLAENAAALGVTTRKLQAAKNRLS